MAALVNQFSMQPTPPERGITTYFVLAIQDGFDSKKCPSDPLTLKNLLKAGEAEVQAACAAIINAEKNTKSFEVLPASMVSSIADIGGCAIIKNFKGVGYDTAAKVLNVAEMHSTTPRDLVTLFHIAMWRGYIAGKCDESSRIFDRNDTGLKDPSHHYLEALDKLDQLARVKKVDVYSQLRMAPLGNLAHLLRGDESQKEIYERICKELDTTVNQAELSPSQSVVSGLYELGIYFARRGQPERSIELLQRADQFADVIECYAARCDVLEYLGDVYSWIGSITEASGSYFRAAKLCQMLPDSESSRTRFANLAKKFRKSSELMGVEIEG